MRFVCGSWYFGFWFGCGALLLVVGGVAVFRYLFGVLDG